MGSASEPVKRVGIVGCGQMGTGIAEMTARAGFEVVVVTSSRESAQRGAKRIATSLDRAVRNGKLADDDRDAALSRITTTTDLLGLAECQLAIEAVREDESLKLRVLGEIDKAIENPDVVLATGTSSIPIVRLGRATERPEQVIGLHFFNPVQVMPLVELIPSLLTSQVAYDRTLEFTAVLRKQVVRSPDRSGFMVNALLIPYLLAAIRMLESGFASADDIDTAMELGCAHPMGPLKLTDLIGLDIILAVSEALHAEFREPHYSPPPLLMRMVDAGLLGKKVGRGFHQYTR
ncbi:3-hydroxybutyryl-CoA dehydrogenase [Amycolatopsis sp. K13G38]|uniref:3-hydroxybutyryl-CoA dehydrogenase n=1 Tax=Amycolatopsis acididurans TaxID=2724524 RepID=A0ABX1J5E8_9PSEU|nr:3-hydroxybutyryl-CoA dehydrogenase [Amycolatopsis acididurans]NKQ55011.1 3-hydroxybutyryl-CoA dehydrogenase [Amycolatopsis acididurans]